jgi:hypothetical protein
LGYGTRARQGSSGNYGLIRGAAARKNGTVYYRGAAGTSARWGSVRENKEGCHSALRNARVGLRVRSTHNAHSPVGIGADHQWCFIGARRLQEVGIPGNHFPTGGIGPTGPSRGSLGSFDSGF